MIIGPGRSLIIALMTAFFMLPAQASETELLSIFQLLKAQQQSKVNYSEEKHLNILDAPMLQAGVLEYIPPNTLIREQREPSFQRFEVTDDYLIIQRKNKERKIALGRHPVLHAFIESIRKVMAGDLDGLRKYYETYFLGSTEKWVLNLTPHDKKLRRLVSKIQFHGERGVLSRIAIYEVNGDKSIMSLTSAKLNTDVN
jgi:outer membrane lipoprotein-sorting protein